jgi:hypothetical protein
MELAVSQENDTVGVPLTDTLTCALSRYGNGTAKFAVDPVPEY